MPGRPESTRTHLCPDGRGLHSWWCASLTRQYTRHSDYNGFVYPAQQQGRETRAICRIRAHRVTLDAIHA